MTREERRRFSTIIRRGGMHPLRRHDFRMSVGAPIPRDVRLYALPPDIIAIYPRWRGYDYVLVGDDVLVIDPVTYEIVAIVPA